jgi:hypothetical protein
MAQPFSFGFSGDDIEVDESEAKVPTTHTISTPSASIPEFAKAKSHRLEELVSAGSSSIRSISDFFAYLFIISVPICYFLKSIHFISHHTV